MWHVATTKDFDDWFAELDEDGQVELIAKVELLKLLGPRLGRPHADTLNGSKHANMKELRVDTADKVVRVAFAFDPVRAAILLVAGDKSGVSQKRFYKGLIAKADKLFDAPLAALKNKGGKKPYGKIIRRPRQTHENEETSSESGTSRSGIARRLASERGSATDGQESARSRREARHETAKPFEARKASGHADLDVAKDRQSVGRRTGSFGQIPEGNGQNRPVRAVAAPDTAPTTGRIAFGLTWQEFQCSRGAATEGSSGWRLCGALGNLG